MTKVNLIIVGYEDKSSNGFDRTRFECRLENGSNIWYSAFRTSDEEKAIVEKLKLNVNKLISVDITQKPNKKDENKPFFNITAFHEIVAPESDAGFSVPTTSPKSGPEYEEAMSNQPQIKPIHANTWNEARKSVKGSAYEKDPVGLAVEFGQILTSRLIQDNETLENYVERIMKISIKAVKQAQEAFS